MDEQQDKQLRARNIKTGLILVFVVLAFFAGFVLRRWL